MAGAIGCAGSLSLSGMLTYSVSVATSYIDVARH